MNTPTTIMSAASYHQKYHGKPKRAKPIQRESHLQQQCVKWFRAQYPVYRDLLFSIPNGGHRNKITAVTMKREGQLAGVPDLFLPVPQVGNSVIAHGLFIELKVGHNKPTELQDLMISHLRIYGYCVEVCYSLEQFQEVINDYLK